MPLRDQPYLPLYIQDFMTDEKLIECSASATGVYIRIMCVLHKQENYGKLLLKQKYKQTDKQIKNFALQLATSLPYQIEEISAALSELLAEKVLFLEGDFLIQKRMVKDDTLSLVRAKAGTKGGKKTQKFAKANAKAKSQANSEIENEYESENKNEIKSIKLRDFEKFENWSEDLLSDQYFEQMLMKEKFNFSPEGLQKAIQSHLELLSRYPNMNPQTVGEFRYSVINHIKEILTKYTNKNGKTDSKLSANSFDHLFEADRQANAT